MRVKHLSLILSILFLILVAGLAYNQIMKGRTYQKLAAENRIRLVVLPGVRGKIFDREGKLLVNSRLSFDCAIWRQELVERAATLNKLSGALSIPLQELERALEKNYFAPFVPTVVASDIQLQTVMKIEEQRLNMAGVVIQTRSVRNYKYNETGGHIFGYVGEINRDELLRMRVYGYRIKDLVGRGGIERTFDNYLRGDNGGMQVEVDNRGRQIRVLGVEQPTYGRDIYLTIDWDLQVAAEEALGEKNGAVIVMDPNTGAVLALVSKPSFDPNVFISARGKATVKKLLTRKDYPMMNRATSCTYPPGSAFKPVVAAAALQTGEIEEGEVFNCGGEYLLGGRHFKCWKKSGHGGQDIREGIKNSCNVFFYQVGRRVGVDKIAEYAIKFGFNEPTGIELPAEKNGVVPSRFWKMLTMHDKWYEGETLNYAIGQGYLEVTPVQVLRMITSIANGGRLLQPYIVQKIGEVEVGGAGAKDTGISEEVLKIVKQGMLKVVEDEGGTGRRARVQGVSIAGKTGTAQTHTGATHAWFGGFAPYNKPKIALVVLVEYGGIGGIEACDVAKAVFTKAQEKGLL